MNIVYIMRGLPGSGKSTRARELIKGQDGVIHSADEFMVVDGRFVFDPTRLPEVHDKCFAAFEESLKRNVPVVIVDNTNVRRSDFARYADTARAHGYEVRFAVMHHQDVCMLARRNIHGVLPSTILRMFRNWEP